MQTRSAVTWLRSCLATALLASAVLHPHAAFALTLNPGDVILVTGSTDNAINSVYRLDPTTLASTLISTGGLLVRPARVTVDHQGLIFVADAISGIVQVDPATGTQTALISVAQLGGGVPSGVCAATDNAIFITMRDGAASVLQFVPSTKALRTVCTGGYFTNPAGLTFGPDGKLYVCEMSSPADGTVPSQGSIVRVDPTSGSEALVVASSLFYAPFEIAFVTSDLIWTANRGWTGHRNGVLLSTRLSDGFSQVLSNDVWAEGVASNGLGNNYLSDCQTMSFDCAAPYTLDATSGSRIGMAGSLAIVPSIPTPARQDSWGHVKSIYR